MLAKIVRIAAAIPGFVFIGHGIGWVVAPEAVAESLGMPLLEGVAASTQIGDLASFFFVTGCAIVYGVVARSAPFLVLPACTIAAAAVFRSLAAALGHADFAPDFIVPEVVMAVLLFAAARIVPQAASTAPPH